MPFSLKFYNILKLQRISKSPFWGTLLLLKIVIIHCKLFVQTFTFLYTYPLSILRPEKWRKIVYRVVLGLFYECKYDTMRVMERWEGRGTRRMGQRRGVQNFACARMEFKIKLVLLWWFLFLVSSQIFGKGRPCLFSQIHMGWWLAFIKPFS